MLVVEMLNSTIEAVTGLVSPAPHPLAALVKDAGSAAVLLALLIALVVWIVVFKKQGV